MSMCCFRTKALPNKSPHSSHLCTFSPVWVIMCLLNVHASPNDFLHSEQVWIFTPLWVSMCAFRWWARRNYLWHWRQVKFFSLLWVTMCFFRSPIWPSDFSHFEQLCCLSPLWLHIRVILVVWFDMGMYTQSGGISRSEKYRTFFWSVRTSIWFKDYRHFYFSMFMTRIKRNVRIGKMRKREHEKMGTIGKGSDCYSAMLFERPSLKWRSSHCNIV